MLLPTQQTYGLAANNMMQSMLDSIEEQRKQEDAKRTGKERDKVAEARVSASEDVKRAKDKITSALFSVNHTDANEAKIQLVDKLAQKLGIDTDEARSSYSLGKALEDALKNMSQGEADKLSKDLGLADMDVSMQTLVAAIKNPYGDDNQRLMDGINRQINGGKLGTEVERVVQRLEDVAKPKTLEELKLGPQGYDPTRVEDDQTKAERQQDIQAAEAGKKLEDVQKVQDVIKTKNDKDIKDAADGKTADKTDGTGDAAPQVDTTLLSLFAAAAEQTANADSADRNDKAAEQDGAQDGPQGTAQDASSKDKSTGQSDVPTTGGDTVPNDLNAKAIEELSSKTATDDQAGILPVRIDEIGLYELLKKKLAA